MRFQKPFVRRDERLEDLQNKYRSNNKENRKQLRKIRQDYSEQRHFLIDRKNDIEKQSNVNMASVKRKKVKIFDCLIPFLLTIYKFYFIIEVPLLFLKLVSCAHFTPNI